MRKQAIWKSHQSLISVSLSLSRERGDCKFVLRGEKRSEEKEKSDEECFR